MLCSSIDGKLEVFIGMSDLLTGCWVNLPGLPQVSVGWNSWGGRVEVGVSSHKGEKGFAQASAYAPRDCSKESCAGMETSANMYRMG